MSWSRTRVAAILAFLLLAAQACGPQLTPEEKTELIRSQYTAELKSLTVKQDPLSVMDDETSEAVADATAAEAEGASPAAAAELDPAADAEPAAAAPPVRSDAILDILLSTTSQQYLPGVTLDLEHVDAARRVKDRRSLWVDTSSLGRGPGIQITHVLENVDWEEGDGFFVEVRTPIPPEERADYREFRGE
ncbi:MAG TPA: hypothetical protein VMS86_04485 [Thermoanaerobaculia bacterium]|nr:hypothetical protein [Thermoanaerobaculia bacterium]